MLYIITYISLLFIIKLTFLYAEPHNLYEVISIQLEYKQYLLHYGGNLLNFWFRCSTRPHEWGTQWESNSLV